MEIQRLLEREGLVADLTNKFMELARASAQITLTPDLNK